MSLKNSKLLNIYNIILAVTLLGCLIGGTYSIVKLNSNLNQVLNWTEADWTSIPDERKLSWEVGLKCCSFRSPSDGLGPYFDPDCSPKSQVNGCQEALAGEMKGRFNIVIATVVLVTLFLMMSLVSVKISGRSGNKVRTQSGNLYRQKS